MSFSAITLSVRSLNTHSLVVGQQQLQEEAVSDRVHCWDDDV